MNTNRWWILALAASFGTAATSSVGTTAVAGKTELRSGLEGWLAASDAEKEWKKYCKGSYTDVSVAPEPNYGGDAIIKAAVDKLKKVDEKSFYMYKETLATYGLKTKGAAGWEWTDAVKSAAKAQGITSSAHGFLVYLCGEFRDRPTMIKEKLTWVSNIYKLPVSEQTKKFDFSKNIWSQVSAKSYDPYLNITRQLWQARKSEAMQLDAELQAKVGTEDIEAATEGMTVCETKYTFAEMVAKGVQWTSIADYRSGYEKFAAVSGNCTEDDKSDYYDFRGDTNFKPNSPESNGMIWRATHMTKYCSSPVKSSDTTKVTDAECKAYYEKPFQSRWDAARAGFASWFFYKDGGSAKDSSSGSTVDFDELFSSTNSLLVVRPKDDSKVAVDASKGPYYFSFNLGSSVIDRETAFEKSWLSKLDKNWLLKDLNYNVMTDFVTDNPNYLMQYSRIKNAVDRHTDWYASGYDDSRGKQMTQAYSPLVASSYEMSESNSFTCCGITIPCTSDHDDRKHWMFIFRIKKDNWYRTQDLAEGKTIDFTKNWMDETAFGTTGLADGEKAWDRLGTAMDTYVNTKGETVKGEYDSIVYLHNIDRNGTVSDDGNN